MVSRRFKKRYCPGFLYVSITFVVTFTFTKERCRPVGSSYNPTAISHRSDQLPGKYIDHDRESYYHENGYEKKSKNETKFDMKNYKVSDIRKAKQAPPKHKISFLKIDRAGSNVIQNILFRFGIRNNLTLVLPEQGDKILSRRHVLPIPKNAHYDIFACYTIYNPYTFKIMPRGVSNVAIIRDPYTRMLDAAFYYRDEVMSEYLLKVPRDDFIGTLINCSGTYDSGVFSRTKNSMAQDFGFSPDVSRKETNMVELYISYLKDRFKIVLVFERLSESLVLLKRMFNWSLKDILSINIEGSHSVNIHLTEYELEKFREINYLDYKIYDFFSEIFDLQVRAQDQDFHEETHHLQRVNMLLEEYCKSDRDLDGLTITESKWNEEFAVSMEECDLIYLDESEFIEKLVDRHKKMYGIK